MNWAQLKDPVSFMCFAGAVVAFCSLTQEVTSLSPVNEKYFLLLNSLTSVKHLGKTPLSYIVFECHSLKLSHSSALEPSFKLLANYITLNYIDPLIPLKSHAMDHVSSLSVKF